MYFGHRGPGSFLPFRTNRHYMQYLLKPFVQGVRQIKKTSLDPVYLFIAPPSFASLRSRLTTRGTESAESVNKRLKTALDEFQYAKSGAHDVVLVNGDGEEELERVYGEFRKVALGEQEGIRGDTLPEFEALDT